MCIIHSWTNWRDIEVNTFRYEKDDYVPVTALSETQRRYCTRCNRRQDRSAAK